MTLLLLLVCGGAQGQDLEPEPPADPGPSVVEGAAVQSVEVTDDDVARLLGDEPVEDAAIPAPESPSLGNGWPIGLAVIAGCLLWYGRRRLLSRATAQTGSELRIVGRTTLGTGAGLAVVEVRGRDGNWRRLVVGTGDGAPSLVADLGEPEFGFLGLADDEATSMDDGFPPLGAPADLQAAIAHTRQDPPELDAHAKRLIDEVLGERGTARRSTFRTLA